MCIKKRLLIPLFVGVFLVSSFPFLIEGLALEKSILTLYQNGPAGLVRKEEVDLGPGTNVLTRTIPERARTSTIFLDSPDVTLKGITIEPEIKGEKGMLEARIGNPLEVKASGVEDTWIEGMLVAVVEGKPLLEISSNKYRLIRDPAEYRFEGSSPPADGKRLEIEVSTEEEGKRTLTYGFQVKGLSWTPGYFGFLKEEEQLLRFRGVAHIENGTDRKFENTELYLLAGSPAREDQGPRFLAARNVAQEEDVSEEKAFEYYRYSLPSTLDLGAGEETRVGFVKERDVDYRRYYEFEPSVSSAVRTFLVLENDATKGLGLPLASGPIRVYRDDEERTFLGAATLPKLPKGNSAELALGEAFDLEGERKRLKHEKLDDNFWRDRISITLTNGKDTPEKVRVIEKLNGSWEITDSSEEYERIDSNRILFEVGVPKDGTEKISYTVEYRY